MSANILLCRSEPYLNGKVLFSLLGELFVLEKSFLDELDPKDLFLITHKTNPKNALSAPTVVQIQTTNKCNLSCKHCYTASGKGYNDEMSNEDIVALLDDLRNWGVLKIQWVGGEVFVKKGFWALVQHAHDLGFEQALLTNGVFFGKAKKPYVFEDAWKYFYTIQVSINAFGSDFDRFVGKKMWQSVCRSVDNLSTHKLDDRTLAVAMIVRNNNIHSIPQIAKMVRGKVDIFRLGKEIITGRSEESQRSSIDALFASWNLLEKLRCEVGQLRITHPFDKVEGDEDSPLPSDWRSDNGARTFMYINAMGLAYPFPLFANIDQFCAGSVLRTGLDKVWNSEGFERYRNITRKETGCGNCKKPCQIWPRYHFIINDSVDIKIRPFPHPGCSLEGGM